jgi:chemotaxis protein CheZ
MGNAAMHMFPAMDEDCSKLSPHEMFLRVGMLTRQLHDAMSELGGTVESAVCALPDARERLGYIEKITGQAAEKVLCAAEAGMEIQSGLAERTRAFSARWDGTSRLDVDAFLAEIGSSTLQTNDKFSQIIVAQDFHDLSGQVLKRVIGVAQGLETQLLKLLLESSPAEQRAKIAEPAGLAGPVINPEGNPDVVQGQAQVDDLLESLGF